MSEVSVREDVVYGRGGGRDLRCDIYTPARLPVRAPALLLLHGGGWSRGERGMMRDTGLRLAGDGFVCIAPEYRLTGESPWPAQIEDVKAAIRWTAAQHAELGIGREQIAAMGFSAGAHLALLAAGTAGVQEFAGSGGNQGAPERLSAVVAVYPPVLFFTGDQRTHGASPAQSLLANAGDEEAARRASPLTYVQQGFPPAFLLHGTADKVVPPSASQVMYEALVRAGAPVELHMYAEQPHGFARQPEFIDLVCAETAHFLRRYLEATSAAEASAVQAAVS